VRQEIRDVIMGLAHERLQRDLARIRAEVDKAVPHNRGHLASSIRVDVGSPPLFSQAWQVPIMLDPGIIEVPEGVDADEMRRQFEASSVYHEVAAAAVAGISAADAADRLSVFGGHRHRDQEVDLVSTGEVVAWFCLDCDRVRYADGW
jgi:hypothetical protein